MNQEFINRRDKRGLKTGVWKVFHENGRIKIEGKYNLDKREGFFREFSMDGKLLNTYKYENGELVENVIEFTDITIDKEYYPGAKVKSEMTLVNGIPNGVFREYYPNGSLESEGNFKNGFLHGVVKEYYPSKK